MIPSGYKQTEIGVIPEEWSSQKIKTFAKICMCKRIFADQTTLIGDIPFYKIGTFGGKPDAYISKRLFNDYREKYSYPTKGDILISAAGTLGRTVVFDGTDSYFQDSNIVWLDIDKAQICNEYLRYYYEVIKWSAAEGSTISRLYNGIIETTCVAIPPLSEQHRIAEALSDVDELITSLEKLIEKKKAIKQGVMQELLTGKRRLPGFTGEWKKKRLKDIGIQIEKGQILTQQEATTGSIPVIAGGRQPAYYCDTYNRSGLNITISASGASAGFVNIYNGRIFASDCSTIGESPSYNIIFIYNALLNIQQKIYSVQTGGAQPHVHPSELYNLEINYTFDVQEQTAIARVLSDVDNEIAAKERELKKYRKLKSGMMSELLTGRLRLA